MSAGNSRGGGGGGRGAVSVDERGGREVKVKGGGCQWGGGGEGSEKKEGNQWL